MKRDWTVLLIGGSSAVGKSHLARQIAQHYKVPLTEIDDIRISLMQFIDPKDNPDLFTFWHNPDHHDKFTTLYMIQKLESIARTVWKALDVLITKHIRYNEPIIFEGDGILPRLVAKRDLDQIQPIFVYDNLEALRKRELRRNRGGDSTQWANKQAKLSYMFGQKILKSAQKYNFPVLEASPLKTLYKRAIQLLERKK